MTTPEISVLFPVYNDERYVAEALSSIQAQTFGNFEILAFDDGSKDRSLEVLEEFASEDSRIKIVHQENAGLGTTLNRAIELAKAPILARQDADDVSNDRRFELQIEHMRSHPNTSLLGTGVRVIDGSGEVKYVPPTLTGNALLKERLRSSSPFAHGSVMMRRELVRNTGGYPTMVWLEDLLLWRALCQLGDVENLAEPLYDYRVVPENLYVPRSLQKKVVQIFQESWPEDNFSDQQTKELERIRRKISPRTRKTQYHLNLAKGLLLNTNKRGEARKNLMAAVKIEPWRVEPWFHLVLSLLPKKIITAWRRVRV